MVNRQRIIDEFTRQAAIESPSFKEGAMSAYLKQRFADLATEIVEDGAGAAVGSQSNNLIFRIPGKKAGEPLLLSGHMDTVGPTEGIEPILEEGVFRSAGNTVLGADDKAGLVEIIEALEVLREEQIDHVPLEVVITICEEVGLLGAKHLDASLLEARRGIALDTTDIDHLIHKAPTANRFTIKVIGQAAHAGVVPENGISAIQIAACAISRMPLGRIDAETTANIGVIEGGQATNIVPRQVILNGEVRSHDPQKLEARTQEIIGLLEEEVAKARIQVEGREIRAALEVDLHLDFPAMHVDLQAEILKLVTASAEQLDFPLTIKAAGGGSDANILNGYGIETVILGTGMNKVHSVDEEVRVDDMIRVSELLVQIIRNA